MGVPMSIKASNKLDWLHGFFEGDDVYVVGGGNSLREFHLDDKWHLLDQKRVIAVNNSYMHTKPDILCFLDAVFPQTLRSRGHYVHRFPFKVLAGWCSSLWPDEQSAENVSIFRTWNQPTKDPNVGLYSAMTSTHVAINAAIIGKARRIYLLGVDGGYINGRGHYFSSIDTQAAEEFRYKRMIEGYEPFIGLAEIFNASPQSYVEAFPKITIDKALRGETP